MTIATLPPVTAADFDAFDADYARFNLMADLANEMRIRFMSDDELVAYIVETSKIDGWNECEGKYELYEIGCRDYDLSIAYAEQDARRDRAELEAAKARYSFDSPLTYHPFAGLAA